MVLFHGWGSTASRLEWEPLWWGSLLFTIKGASTKNLCHPWKKENSWRKSVFQIMLNEVLKICEKWYLLKNKNIIRTAINKRSGGCIFLSVFIRNTFKIWNIMWKGDVFFVPNIVSILIFFVKNRGGGGGVLKRQNPLSMTKVICRQSLSSKKLLVLIFYQPLKDKQHKYWNLIQRKEYRL